MSMTNTEIGAGIAEEIHSATRELLTREGLPGGLHHNEPATAGLWTRVAGIGLTGLLLSEQREGIGGSTPELIAAFHAVGQCLAPLPLAEAVAVLGATYGLDMPGVTALRDEVLAGRNWVALAYSTIDTDGIVDNGAWEGVTITQDRIVGHKSLVNFGASAAWSMVTGRSEDGAPCVGLVDHRAVAGSDSAVEVTERTSADPTYRPADLRYENCSTELLAVGDDAVNLWQRIETVMRLASTAELAGIAESLLEIGRNYTLTREQFGKPIGGFQAIKHLAADLHVIAYNMQSVCQAVAATELSQVSEHTAASVKAFCARAALRSAEITFQILGGIGYTEEHDFGLYYRRCLTLHAAPGSQRHRSTARIIAAPPGMP